MPGPPVATRISRSDSQRGRQLARAAPSAATPVGLVSALQRTAGNAAVTALLSRAGRETLGRRLAGASTVRPYLSRMAFERFQRYGVLSNWGAYNAAEGQLLQLERDLGDLVGALEPWLAGHRDANQARAELVRLRTAVVADSDYEPTRKALERLIDRLSSARQGAWKARRDQFRDAVVSAERDPAKFNQKATRATLATVLRRSLGELQGQQLQTRVDDLRRMVDTLPGYIPEHAVNAAHAALNPYDRQVGVPGVGYLAPSRTPDSQHVMNRGISEVVTIEGQVYVPVYVAVYGDALKEQPEHKDVGQDPEGHVQIHTGGGKKGDTTFWLSIGRPLRQIKWLEKYRVQKSPAPAPEPLIRSFLIPLAIADRASASSITEHHASGSGKDLNVDKHFEANQFGIVSPESLELLRAHALPGSLRTYTDAALTGRPPTWGEVRPVAELRERLGVPPKSIPGFAIFVDELAGDFTEKSKYRTQTDTLSRIYAYHTGNPLFLPAGAGGKPETMPPGPQRKSAVETFFKAHKPPELADSRGGLDKFIEEYIAPWATQSKIAEAVYENYDDLSGPEREALPTAAVGVKFTPASAESLRGQRRSGAIEQSERQRQLLEQRRDFRAALDVALKATEGAFGELDPAHKRALHQLKTAIEDIKKDYKFSIGDMNTVRTNLPQYKEQVRTLLSALAPHTAGRPNVKVIVDTLTAAVA